MRSLGIMIAAAVWLAAWGAANAQGSPAATPGVQEEAFVPIGGIDQWVTIRGQDPANPVILVVGGRGGGIGSLFSPFPQFYRSWEKAFTVVQWDQRGAGKTFGRAGQKIGPELTIDRLVADGNELAGYLRGHLHRRKIVLMGVGYGTIVAVKMAKARPDLYSVYVASGQIATPRPDREQYFHDRLVRLAKAKGDKALLADLELAGPHPWGDPSKAAVVGRMTSAAQSYRAPVPSNAQMTTEALNAPGWTMADITAARAGIAASTAQLQPAFDAVDFKSLGGRFSMPVVVIQGEENDVEATPAARAWFEGITAPRKVFATVPIAGNHLLDLYPEEVLTLLDRHVRPLALEPARR